jgi:hypothetical protein
VLISGISGEPVIRSCAFNWKHQVINSNHQAFQQIAAICYHSECFKSAACLANLQALVAYGKIRTQE